MPAVIFAGDSVKTLKNTIQLFNGASLISGVSDPRSVATEAEPGSVYLNTLTGRRFRKLDSGSSTNWLPEVESLSKNYIENNDAEVGLDGWATYDDGAVAPVDGTGGTPTVITLNQTTVVGEVLRGLTSFEIAKTAADGQGEGASYDFTIDPHDQGKDLRILLDYKTTADYASDDIEVFVYDVGNSNLITPANNGLAAASSGDTATVDFTAAANSTSYRLIFHVATTNALAYDLYFDNVQVYPSSSTAGSGLWVLTTITSTSPVNFIPPSNINQVLLRACGGGGGGGGGGATNSAFGRGGGGGGGGAAGYCSQVWTVVTGGATYSCQAGTGGAAGAGSVSQVVDGGNGGDGINSIFDIGNTNGHQITFSGSEGGRGGQSNGNGFLGGAKGRDHHELRATTIQGITAGSLFSGGGGGNGGNGAGVNSTAGGTSMDGPWIGSNSRWQASTAGTQPTPTQSAGGPGAGGGSNWFGVGGTGGKGGTPAGTRAAAGSAPAAGHYGCGGGGGGGEEGSPGAFNSPGGGAGNSGVIEIYYFLP